MELKKIDCKITCDMPGCAHFSDYRVIAGGELCMNICRPCAVSLPELAKEVLEDFESRQNMRRALELQWELNINFLSGQSIRRADADRRNRGEGGRILLAAKGSF